MAGPGLDSWSLLAPMWPAAQSLCCPLANGPTVPPPSPPIGLSSYSAFPRTLTAQSNTLTGPHPGSPFTPCLFLYFIPHHGVSCFLCTPASPTSDSLGQHPTFSSFCPPSAWPLGGAQHPLECQVLAKAPEWDQAGPARATAARELYYTPTKMHPCKRALH